MIRGTNLFIYLLEDYGNLSAAVAELRTKMLQSGDQLLTSTFTLAETLVKPTETGDLELGRKYEQVLTRLRSMTGDCKTSE